MRGPVLDEVHQQLNPWVSQVIQLAKKMWLMLYVYQQTFLTFAVSIN